MRIKRFEEIEAWKASRMLNQALMSAHRKMQCTRDGFWLRQIRKCPISAMANIAEGFDAGTNREFVRFLRIAYRSVTEFQSHLYAGLDGRYFDQQTFDQLYLQAHETKGRIGGFTRYLKQHLDRPPR
ncbi:MAG TPA: four helix bundle protein [Planctomycetota bacterium]|nr:four helix bundle protein [Planctomycetota bacterium]